MSAGEKASETIFISKFLFLLARFDMDLLCTVYHVFSYVLFTTIEFVASKSIPIRVVFFAPKHDSALANSVVGFWPNAGGLNVGLERVVNESILSNLTLPNNNNSYNIELVHRDGQCNAIETMREAQRLIENHEADLFIGPGCTSASISLNTFAEANRIPHILWVSGSAELSDRRTHPHVIRPVQNYFLAGTCIANFLQNEPFNWNRIAIVTQSENFLCKLFTSGLPLNRYFQNTNENEAAAKKDGRFLVAGEHTISKSTTDDVIDAILDTLSKQARIIFTCFWEDVPDLHIRFILRAQQRGMLMPNSGYVWLRFTFPLDLPSKPYLPYLLRTPTGPQAENLTETLRLTNLTHLIGKEEQIVEGFQSVIETSWYVRAEAEFRRKVYANLAKPPWNYTTERIAAEKPPSTISTGGQFSACLADSVYLHALAVRKALLEGVDYRDSGNMYRIMKTIHFSGLSGDFALNNDGERLPNLIFFGPSMRNSGEQGSSFSTKGILSCSLASNSTSRLVPHYEVAEPFMWWSKSDENLQLAGKTSMLPPPDVPPCGFYNEHCRTSLAVITAPSVAAFVLVLCCVGVALWYYRQSQRKRKLLLMTWKLQPDDIEIVENHNNGLSASTIVSSPAGRSSSMASSHNNNSSSMATLSVGSNMPFGVPVVFVGQKSRIRQVKISSAHTARTFAESSAHNAAVLVKVRGSKLAQMFSLKRPPQSKQRNESRATTRNSKFLVSGGEYSTETLELLQFIKQDMQHDNINMFIGACFDYFTEQDSKLSAHRANDGVMIYEHNAKGTLADMLNNEEFALDWLFQLSFATDIVEGLYYVHTNASPLLKFHGCLRSDMIGIDQRCTAKLTCCGAWHFGMDNARTLYDTKQYAKLLYVAPELITQAAHPVGDDNVYEGHVAENLKAENWNRKMQKTDIYSCAVILCELLYRECITCDSFVEQSKKVKLANTEFRTDLDIILILSDEKVSSATVRPKLSAIEDEGHKYPAENDRSLAANNVAYGRSVSNDKEAVAATTSDVVTKHAATSQLQTLIRMCWRSNARERPTASELRKSMRNINAMDGGGGTSFMDRIITRMESYSQNLEALVNARTKELLEEQKRSDMLLSEILPPTVVQQLKSGRPVEPELFDSTTVYFSDIVQFTVIAGRLSPMGVVELLNKLFGHMDEHIGQYAAYKVETIGDAYMVVSGLPERRLDHAVQIALMALSIRAGIGSIRVSAAGDLAETESVRIRIGINSGPCVAGVVGVKMPRYCLFGDTVNVASRMESHGEPMRIHVSNATAELLANGMTSFSKTLFKIEPRGKVDIKGKGLMNTYWLE